MKKAFLLLFVFAATTAFAQNKKLSIGAAVMPLWSDFLIVNKGPTFDDILADERKRNIGVPGFNTHVFGESQVNKWLTLRIGLGYSQTGVQESKLSELTWPSPGPNNPNALQYELVCQDISVPVTLKLRPKKIPGCYGLVGFATWVSLSRTQKRTFWYPDGRKETIKRVPTDSFQKFNSNLTLGFGYDVRLYSKVHLFFEPVITCNAWYITQDATFGFLTFTAGLNTGVRF